MAWRTSRRWGYLSPAVERSVRAALAQGKSEDSVIAKFPTIEDTVRESWAFWSQHVPTDLDARALQEWIYAPFRAPDPEPAVPA